MLITEGLESGALLSDEHAVQTRIDFDGREFLAREGLDELFQGRFEGMHSRCILAVHFELHGGRIGHDGTALGDGEICRVVLRREFCKEILSFGVAVKFTSVSETTGITARKVGQVDRHQSHLRGTLEDFSESNANV